MDDKPEDPCDERVGYGRPPKASQFKKGQSGNPLGRPRKPRDRQSVAARVLGETQRLTGQPKGSRVRYTTLEVIVMKVKQLATAGRLNAAALFLRLSERHARQETAQPKGGFIVVPEELTPEEWMARYSPKEPPPDYDQHNE